MLVDSAKDKISLSASAYETPFPMISKGFCAVFKSSIAFVIFEGQARVQGKGST